MKSRLCQIKNWAELARAAKYRASVLAKSAGVSIRELERFFLCETGRSPRAWMNELRQVEALSLIILKATNGRSGAAVRPLIWRETNLSGSR